MRTPRLSTCLSGLVATVVLTACGDDGSNNSASATQGTNSTTAPSTSATSTPTTTDGGSNSATETDSASGTMGETQGQTTTNSPTTSTTTMTGSTTDPMTSTGTSTGSTTGTTGPVSGTTDDTTSTTGNGDCMPGDSGGMGDVEKSFLWVANSDQGTISKVDTQGVVELARYRSGPNGANYTDNPSRTAVSVDGRFVVVNNRQSGWVTMIAANLEDCVDKNNNGMIDTSQSPANILPWMPQDECIRWSTQLPIQQGNVGAGPRGVTWTPGTWDKDACAFVDPKVWVGYLPANQFNTAHMARLDGQTGVVEETVVVNNWIHGWSDYGPYGAALDKDYNVWFTQLRGELFKIDTGNNNTLSRWLPPGGDELYGMTVDPDGDPWFGNCSGGGVSTFNPMNQQFTTVPGTGNQFNCYRGLAADREGHVWVASNGTCGVVQIDHVTNTMVQFHTLNPCSTPVGVSVDDEGFVWVVDEYQGAWKIDPINPMNKQFLPIANDHYTYSDMTGGQLKSVVLPQ